MSQKISRNIDNKINEIKFIINHFLIKLKREQPVIENPRFIKIHNKLKTLETSLKKLNTYKKSQSRFALTKQFIVNTNSKVKLVSIKIGAILWIEAKNYIDLIGQTVGDVVYLYGNQFKIAAVYA